MSFDLQTLLALWIGLDIVVALAFFVQYRRQSHMNAARWWAWASVAHLAGAISLVLRPLLPPWLALPPGALLFTLTFALLWIGLRAHLGLSIGGPIKGVKALLAASWPLYVFFIVVVDSLYARQLLWVASSAFLVWRMLEDTRRTVASPQPPEWRALQWALRTQIGGMVVSVVLAPLLQWTMEQTVGALIFFFYFVYLFITLVLHGLIMQRLRHEADVARAAQRQRETDLSRLLDNLDAGVIVFRPDRTPMHMNAAARRFLGLEFADDPQSSGAPLLQWTLLGDDGEPLRRHDQPFERVLVTGQPVRDLILGVQLEGTGPQRWILCSGYPDCDEHGGLRSVVLTFIDISAMREAQAEQKALETRLAQSQKMQALGTLAGGVAHDFNNILAAILGNVDLAREEFAAASHAQESLDEIRTAARRGRELVRQILAFSRQQPLLRERLQMSAVVAESCALLRAALTPQVQLLQTVQEGVPLVCADPTQLQQVLVNLGTNALHALQGRSGQVEFLLDTIDPNERSLPAELRQACALAGLPAVRVRVRDNGCGMDDAVLRRVFEPFFTTKPVGHGTGLGLPVVMGIVEAHGGHISLHSRVGEGTTVTLVFPPHGSALDTAESKPVTMPRVEPISPESNDAGQTELPHVLYLDDDDTLVFLVRRLLERRGYRVTAVGLQDEALSLVREKPGHFDLLLTDYNMPGMSGLDVAREALAVDPALTVAVASGYITDELQAEARAVGVREVVFKTDAVDQFCEVVARLVRPAAA